VRYAGLVFSVLIPAYISAQQLRVDHVTIAGVDLGKMQKEFAAAGIPTEYGGKHTNGMTEMAVASFADGSYLELIAAQQGANVTKHYWGDFIKDDAGPCAWAIAVNNMTAEAGRLQAAGITIHPVKSGRKRPDGVDLAWETASIGPGPQGTFMPFLIHDETPRKLRAFPHGTPTAPHFKGVAVVVVGVRDLDGAISQYRQAFGLAEPRRQDDASLQVKLAAFEGTPIVLAAPLTANSWLASRLQQFGEAPVAYVLSTSTAAGQPVSEQSNWFGKAIGWMDPKKLGGARIGTTP
jgi:Glyoxalase-like domain